MPTVTHILYYLTTAYQFLALAGAVVIGLLFFVKRSGSRPANRLYAILLLVAAGMQLHFIFAATHFSAATPQWPYLPIYFSLSLPVLFFYYVKITLFPKYRPRRTDLKHGILPLGQIFYLWAIFLVPAWRVPGGRHFFNPFYGGLEQALFIALFPLYIGFAYRFFRHRRRSVGHLSRNLWYVQKLLKGTALFVLSYAILGLSDFLLYKFFHVDPRTFPLFAALAAGSFSTLVLFFVVYGFQVLLWGRRLLRLQDARRGE